MLKKFIKDVGQALPKRIRHAILHLGFDIAREEFDLFAFRYALAPHMFHGLRLLRDRGYEPATIIDVGAFKGDWSRGVHKIWPASKQVMVEPNAAIIPEFAGAARELGATAIQELLGKEAGAKVEFAVMESGSSVFHENSPLPREVEERMLQTLDSVIDLERLEGSVLLKLDTQGYELEVLAGGEGVLSKCDMVLLEVSLIEINKGCPLVDTVIAYLAARDFRACEVIELHRRPLDAAMNQIDLVFVREDHPLFSNTSHF
ncbi:MAG: FkbM family methyltransferase [Phycisphaerales bacterium]|nr:FkbM family methyltransferase [Phycisphaerales bacterium]